MLIPAIFLRFLNDYFPLYYTLPPKDIKFLEFRTSTSFSVIRRGFWECLRSVQIFNAILLSVFSAAA
ncbi:hypothetical protein AMJ44_00245 [candidate division WOR-1 bacterium DG_54_3]|uniref:Uncharacterized protein n=1 Tax=candidate division WOR-1 bacterium DG_54_3 TaxID=1703775 RepID=A0A0S7Y7H7_UNCSA|nr:MAG: hypothetical protein AMJ44_00245 [candidate division WOR-1 bacterium DG_54_3]